MLSHHNISTKEINLVYKYKQNHRVLLFYCTMSIWKFSPEATSSSITNIINTALSPSIRLPRKLLPLVLNSEGYEKLPKEAYVYYRKLEIILHTPEKDALLLTWWNRSIPAKEVKECVANAIMKTPEPWR